MLKGRPIEYKVWINDLPVTLYDNLISEKNRQELERQFRLPSAQGAMKMPRR